MVHVLIYKLKSKSFIVGQQEHGSESIGFYAEQKDIIAVVNLFSLNL